MFLNLVSQNYLLYIPYYRHCRQKILHHNFWNFFYQIFNYHIFLIPLLLLNDKVVKRLGKIVESLNIHDVLCNSVLHVLKIFQLSEKGVVAWSQILVSSLCVCTLGPISKMREKIDKCCNDYGFNEFYIFKIVSDCSITQWVSMLLPARNFAFAKRNR